MHTCVEFVFLLYLVDGSGAMYEASSCFSAPATTSQRCQQYGSRYDE